MFVENFLPCEFCIVLFFGPGTSTEDVTGFPEELFIYVDF